MQRYDKDEIKNSLSIAQVEELVVELYDIFSSNSFPSTTSQSSLYQTNLELLILLSNQTFWNP